MFVAHEPLYAAHDNPVQFPLQIFFQGSIRVSTQRQVSEGDSLEAQERAIVDYIQQELKVKLEPETLIEQKMYIETGKSAKNQNRPQLQALLRDIQSGQINWVICWKLDRITRSVLDFAQLWEFFKEHGVEFVSLREKFETSSAMGNAMLMIIMIFAQLERELTGERTLATMLDRAARGIWNGGHILGYRKDDSGHLVPDPEWAPVVQHEFFDAFAQLSGYKSNSVNCLQQATSGFGAEVAESA